MASIGLALRDLQRGDSLISIIRAHLAAGIVSAGPWLISILSILFIAPLVHERVPDPQDIAKFQVMVTYVFAGSLVVTGPLQFILARVASDFVHETDDTSLLPNLGGAMAVTALLCGLLAALVSPWFSDVSTPLYVLFALCFMTVSCAWSVTIVLNMVRDYFNVLASYAFGYTSVLGLAYLLAPWSLEGLLAAFVLGQTLLVLWGVAIVARAYPSPQLLRLDMLRGGKFVALLAATGLMYNLGIWVDKVLFWAHPQMGEAVIGPLRNSAVYDFPIFLAYLGIVPGMAVFLLVLETDLSQAFSGFFGSIRDGATLSSIERFADEAVGAARHGLSRIVRTQVLTFLSALVLAPAAFERFGVSALHRHLFYVDLAAVSMQVVVLAVLSILFYLDRRVEALGLCVVFFILNLVGTLLSQRLGPTAYGYGFAFATVATALLGILLLNRAFARLVQRTFTSQGGTS